MAAKDPERRRFNDETLLIEATSRGNEGTKLACSEAA